MGKRIVDNHELLGWKKGATSIRITWSEMNVIEFS